MRPWGGRQPTRSRPLTRAFVFTDLRGYSAYTERHGDQAAERLIARYRAIVRKQIAAFAGAEIRTEGDSFYVVFDSVSEAVAAALAIREATAQPTEGEPIPVGIGIHAGESRDGEQGIVSSAVNVAARICSVASAGEVLVTDTVRSLIRTAVPIEFRPVGRRRLKGIAEPMVLYRAASSAHSATATRRRGVIWLVGGGLLVVLLSASLIRLAMSAGTTASEEAPSASQPSPATDVEPAETSGLARFQDRGDYPNAAETELLGRLLGQVADGCDRADPADTPTWRFDLGDPGFNRPVAMLTRAGLSCLTEGIRVHYWQASGGVSGVGVAPEYFFNAADRLGLSPGDCSAESRVYDEWSAGAYSGRVMCYVSVDGSAVLEWTFDEPNIYATASRRSGASSELWRWWLETGRLLGR